MAVSPEQIYAEELYSVGKGYPLWQADPLEAYPSIRVGDCGHLLYGKLYPEWNTYSDEEFKLQTPTILKTRINASNPFTSRTIKRHFVSADTENYDLSSAMVKEETNILYDCSSSRGAILALIDGYAVSKNLTRSGEREFLNFVLCNIDRIAKTCNLSIQDLIAVTGCTLTGDWDAAVVYGNSGSYAADGATNIVKLNTGISLRHSHDLTINVSGGHHHNPPKEGPDCCSHLKNQCVFIRSFRFKKRFLSSKYKVFTMKAAAEPHEDKKDPGSGCGEDAPKVPAGLPCYESDEPFCIQPEKFPPQQTIEDSADELFNWIFQNNKTAEIAVIHDRDIMRWKDEYFKHESWEVQEGIFPDYKVAYVRQPQAKALIISLRYYGQIVQGSDFEIREDEPHADAIRLRDLLIGRYHYTASDITLVLEGSSSPEVTTKAGLLNKIEALVEGVNDNDRVLFFFSGHALQRFASVDEPVGDGFTETIWPTDHQNGRNVLYEHDIHEALVAPLQDIACKLTAIFDTCSSEAVLDLSGTIDFTQMDNIKIIQESIGASELHKQFSYFGAGQEETHDSLSMTSGGGHTFLKGNSPRLRVIRGKLGLRENYICTSFSDSVTTNEKMGEFNTGQVCRYPIVVQFSRRAVIRSDFLDSMDGEGSETRGMNSYHEGYSNPFTDLANAQVERTINQVLDELPGGSERNPDRFTFEFFKKGLHGGLTILVTHRMQKLIYWTKRVMMSAELLYDQPNLLKASNWETHSTIHELSIFIMNLKHFYNECSRLLSGIGQLNSDELEGRYTAIERRATEYKQTLIGLWRDVPALEVVTREINPQTLPEDDANYKSEYVKAESSPRATIVSWTNAVPSNMYDVVQGRNGIVKALLDILGDSTPSSIVWEADFSKDEVPHPCYWDILNNLSFHLQKNEKKQSRNHPVMSNGVQLSSIKTLNLREQLTL